MDIRNRLEEGARQLDVTLTETQLDLLMDYLAMIQKWNKAYNLVGTSNANELIQKHLLDSLSVIPHIKMSPLLDVGSGAGLPGIPLAICLPDISFTLLDSNGKKARFMRQVVMDLKITNVEIVQIRVENYVPSEAPKTVLTRAFAPLEKALKMLSEVCAPQGQVQLMLGTQPDELPALDEISKVQVHSVTIPGLDSQRHLLIADRV
jgi:16S rRNA (guanine527-N7)-methyltransferase|tara:strand:+ start:66 stop:683 length:618 start_codon:yes stop_codon:yes gene_type:complete